MDDHKKIRSRRKSFGERMAIAELTSKNNSPKKIFSGYQIFLVFILAFLQFTVILDFMILSPLGAILLKELSISTSQFGLVVSAYAFSAGISGFLSAGFADRFDRKKMLLIFYAGFLAGTFLCSRARSYEALLIARIVTGFFGGVMNSIVYAIITDMFKLEVRGRVMGFVQMAFSSSQVLGLPLGLFIANHLGWHATFDMIVLAGVVVGIVIYFYMRPVDEHLKLVKDLNVFRHLFHTISKPQYLIAFAATTLLATGGFMVMPFASAFTVNNMGISLDKLPVVYMVSGTASMVMGPIIGRISDSVGKFPLFAVGSLITMSTIIFLCTRGITPLVIVILLNVVLFAGISSRMISGMALMTAVPEPEDRGAFMGVNASVQQLSGGTGSAIAGLIVVQTAAGKIEHYDTLGYVVAATMLITVAMMFFIDKMVTDKIRKEKV